MKSAKLPAVGMAFFLKKFFSSVRVLKLIFMALYRPPRSSGHNEIELHLHEADTPHQGLVVHRVANDIDRVGPGRDQDRILAATLHDATGRRHEVLAVVAAEQLDAGD